MTITPLREDEGGKKKEESIPSPLLMDTEATGDGVMTWAAYWIAAIVGVGLVLPKSRRKQVSGPVVSLNGMGKDRVVNLEEGVS